MRVAAACLIVVFAGSAPAAQTGNALAAALRAAVRPALPFSDAADDGTPKDGSADPAWVVRWPSEVGQPVEVLANPLNAANRRRALEVEEQIQKAAMRAAMLAAPGVSR